MKTVICARGKPPVQGKLIIILTSGEHVQCITLAYCTCRLHVVVLSCTFTDSLVGIPLPQGIGLLRLRTAQVEIRHWSKKLLVAKDCCKLVNDWLK